MISTWQKKILFHSYHYWLTEQTKKLFKTSCKSISILSFAWQAKNAESILLKGIIFTCVLWGGCFLHLVEHPLGFVIGYGSMDHAERCWVQTNFYSDHINMSYHKMFDDVFIAL